ncbi:transmembrane protein, putative (macronuclear) [Tetrahymena thermophila SB210]|uniref:Transmembrane protein, putative n=1 Tax=Tetrahymena thermophila (strain SB210) TaxID=312017 RepID=W7X3V9_TETTS|nr:transmembrane protein, putative [Tetrahymena thermophila SB210]EWS71113.1 transmembrane protein, putative [Tetrahymena thermophila SB210]|eukprot:XP_012656356.1 transmembrane protein, putative [Tetrahymena thermophila SB210]
MKKKKKDKKNYQLKKNKQKINYLQSTYSNYINLIIYFLIIIFLFLFPIYILISKYIQMINYQYLKHLFLENESFIQRILVIFQQLKSAYFYYKLFNNNEYIIKEFEKNQYNLLQDLNQVIQT